MSLAKRFEQQILEMLKRELHPAFVRRQTDVVQVRNGVTYGVKSPPDVWASGFPHQYLVEAKTVLGSSIPFDRLKQHQLDDLLEFDAVSEFHHGMIAVLFYNKLTGVRKLKRAFMVPARLWQVMHRVEERKSIPLRWLEQRIPLNELEWVPATGWKYTQTLKGDSVGNQDDSAA